MMYEYVLLYINGKYIFLNRLGINDLLFVICKKNFDVFLAP